MHPESTRQKLSLAERCQKRHEGASWEPRAARAEQTSNVSEKVWKSEFKNAKPSKRRHPIWTTESEIYASEMSNGHKTDESYRSFSKKSWWNHLRSAPKSFCWFISTKRKAIAKFGSRRMLWKIVVMNFEVFCIDRRSLTPESFEQFWRAFLHICCKSENFVIFVCKSILPPSLMAELDLFAKFLIS